MKFRKNVEGTFEKKLLFQKQNRWCSRHLNMLVLLCNALYNLFGVNEGISLWKIKGQTSAMAAAADIKFRRFSVALDLVFI
jgi:hypothetical protein